MHRPEIITDQVEEAQDLRAYDRAKQQDGEGFPQEVMRRLVHGETRSRLSANGAA